MPEGSDHVDRIVERWGAERPDIDGAALGLFARLFRATHLADVALARSLALHGLQPGWFDIMAALRRAGSPYELNAGDLTQATMLSTGGTTKRLDRLAAAGLVERRPDPNDRRGTVVRLTRRGRVVIDRALQAHVRREEELLHGLSAADRDALEALLRRLLADLEPVVGVPVVVAS